MSREDGPRFLRANYVASLSSSHYDTKELARLPIESHSLPTLLSNSTSDMAHLSQVFSYDNHIPDLLQGQPLADAIDLHLNAQHHYIVMVPGMLGACIAILSPIGLSAPSAYICSICNVRRNFIPGKSPPHHR